MSNSTEKFSHLDNVPPIPGNILNIPVDRITNEHLHTLRSNLEEKLNNKNPEVASAAYAVIGKIDNIIGLGNTTISGEIMKASSDEDYQLAA